MRKDGLAGSRVLPDEQSLSFRGRDARCQLGGRDAVVLEHLHGAVQPPAQIVRPPFQRTLQIAHCGWQRQRLLADGLRLCAFESRAGEVAASRTEVARLCVEQLAGVSAAAGTASDLAAGGLVARRITYSQGQCCGTGGIGKLSGSAPGAGGRRGIEENPARLVSGRRSVPAGLLAQARARVGDDRVAKLKIEPDEQNEFKLE